MALFFISYVWFHHHARLELVVILRAMIFGPKDLSAAHIAIEILGSA
jgi:hypothetical protein